MIDALMYGMIPREKIAQFSSAKQVEQRRQTAAGALAQRRAEPFLQNGLVDTGSRDRSSQTHNHDYRQRIQNTPAEFRYFYCVEKSRDHPLNLQHRLIRS
jgi:hypothetical protein